MLIDTHLHLINNDKVRTIINDSFSKGVEKLIISGCDKMGIRDALEIIKNNDNIYATIGFHPSEAEVVNDDDIKDLKRLLKSNSKIVGIGEIGLDYYYGKDNREQQLKLFDSQLKIAQEMNMPVVIHSRDAFQDTYDILNKYNLKGIIHCFNGSIEVADLYIKLGYCLGIGGVVTFKNSKLSNVVEKIPLTNIVLETDSPYLTPEPYRGKENTPAFIPIVVDKIAEVKKISTKEVEKITTNNVFRIFDLK